MLVRKLLILALLLALGTTTIQAKDDYKTSKEYLALRDALHRGFNSSDSAQFYPALKNLEDYLLKQDDLHEYYTQRCNEIIFLMNSQKIYEAYILARKLSLELREKGLDKEMYMAYNMLGHINRYCGNKETAKENFRHVIKLMEQADYYESMPPIYMNIVNVELGDDPEEADRLLERAKEIAQKYSPERVFDIETRRTLSYFNRGDIEKFLEGYKEYEKGVKEGKTSVDGATMETYYLATIGKTEEAIARAKEMGERGNDAVTMIYERAGKWKEAYESLRKGTTANDSINNVILINSMQGIRDQLTAYDAEKETARNKLIFLTVILILLVMLVVALAYIVNSRRRYIKELKKAYNHAMESDRMKTAFIQNVSHEVRTPLNIISGFAQVLSNPELASGIEDRQQMSQMMQKNARIITSLIDEMLELSNSEKKTGAIKDDEVEVNDTLCDMLQEYEGLQSKDTVLKFESSLSEDFKIMTNKLMLRRIVGSLIDNAIKNTPTGLVTLKVSANNQELKMIVEDTGKGIPAEEAEHIFERFTKLDSFKEGLGLGLTLCRSMTERLGGTVKLDTTYKIQGARFIVVLPL